MRFAPPDRLQAVHPAIRPGPRLAHYDFRHQPLPGERVRNSGTANGGQYGPVPDGYYWGFAKQEMRVPRDPELYVRDACVWSSFTAYEAGAIVGLFLRWSQTGFASTFYGLELTLGANTATLFRRLVYPDRTESTTLHAPATQPTVAPLGQRNVVELRIQGASLQAFVNSVPVCTVHDPVYGVGGIGLRMGRDGASKAPLVRVVVHEMAVHGVMA